jgi:CHAD domain-containing protein
MPTCVLPQASTHGPGHAAALASGSAFQILLLDLLASTIGPETRPAAKKAAPLPNATIQAVPASAGTEEKALPLKVALARRLNKWLARIVQQGSRFQELAIEDQHDLRKKVKRLRYGLNFSEALLSRSTLERVLAALTQAQDTLGELNDLYVAEQAYRALLDTQTQAWFAVGWLRSMQTQKKREAQAMFKALAKAGKLKS